MTALYFSLVMVTVIWGGAFPTIAIALKGLSPYELLIYRHLIAVVCFLPWLWKSWRMMPLKDLHLFLVIGTLMVPVYHVGLNVGELRVPPAVASFIVSLTPLLTVVLASIFLRERLKANSIVGLLLGLAGVALMVREGESRGDFSWKWILWVVVALLSSAINTIFAKRLLTRYDPIFFTAWSLAIGTLVSVLLMPWVQSEYALPQGVETWAALVFLGVVSNFLAYWLWFNGLKRLAASQMVVFLYLVPLWGTILSAWLTKEVLTAAKVAGGAMVILGVILGTGANSKGGNGPAITISGVRLNRRTDLWV